MIIIIHKPRGLNWAWRVRRGSRPSAPLLACVEHKIESTTAQIFNKRAFKVLNYTEAKELDNVY